MKQCFVPDEDMVESEGETKSDGKKRGCRKLRSV